jgi:hypothetical protein
MKDQTQGHDDRLTELFVPDTLLPSQYFDRVARRADHGGEFRLMLAILEDAVDVYRKQAGAGDARRRALFDDAESWIESDDRSWLFSFENICATLGIDSGYLRKGLRAWKRRAGHGSRGTVISFRPEEPSRDDLPKASSY